MLTGITYSIEQAGKPTSWFKSMERMCELIDHFGYETSKATIYFNKKRRTLDWFKGDFSVLFPKTASYSGFSNLLRNSPTCCGLVLLEIDRINSRTVVYNKVSDAVSTKGISVDSKGAFIKSGGKIYLNEFKCGTDEFLPQLGGQLVDCNTYTKLETLNTEIEKFTRGRLTPVYLENKTGFTPLVVGADDIHALVDAIYKTIGGTVQHEWLPDRYRECRIKHKLGCVCTCTGKKTHYHR